MLGAIEIMTSLFDDLIRITSKDTEDQVRRFSVRSFAEQLNWTPSYEFEGSFGIDMAGDHVVVEHGLSNSAVFSFIKSPHRASDLDQTQLRSLLSISYNNLVDWHVFVSQTDVRQINNLAKPTSDPLADQIFSLSSSDYFTRLNSDHLDDAFDTSSIRRSYQQCDDAVIQVISRWKSLLRSDYPSAKNHNISALFNALIFVRGCEDRGFETHSSERNLLKLISKTDSQTLNAQKLLSQALNDTGVNGDLGNYVELSRLEPFAELDRATAMNLCRDFYSPQSAPYDLNFALMSKHALSRIYERYVAILSNDEVDDDGQLHFINPVAVEAPQKKTGVVYTPQFVAGFFARYIRENTTPRSFRSLDTLDPACGSGIFLRTLLELQCNPQDPGVTKKSIQDLFAKTVGIDVDPNACEATRLSLALLHLVATDELPESLSVKNANAISEMLAGRVEQNKFGAIITNPPYIKLDHLADEDRLIIKEYLGDEFKGRLDAYLPFVKLCLESLQPSGLACFVLPQVFLNARNAESLRKTISNNFDVRCLIDLSAVSVFEGVGAYSILLIVQKRIEGYNAGVSAQIGLVSAFAGPALQACLDGRSIDTPYYRVFPVDQDFFESKNWTIISPTHLEIDKKLKLLPKISSYCNVQQGFVTGADGVFIRQVDEIDQSERAIYSGYLPDKKILRFDLPDTANSMVFYPYIDGELATEIQLQQMFPETWQYLNSNREKLSRRRRSPTTPWWKPERPRSPDRILRPKIVCPHLMLTPRFAVDNTGKYAVSRTPFIVAKEQSGETVLLNFFCAILNSPVAAWFLRTYAPKYQNGYNRIEVNLLKSMPVPELSNVDANIFERIDEIVNNIAKSANPSELQNKLDDIVLDLYGLGSGQRDALLGL